MDVKTLMLMVRLPTKGLIIINLHRPTLLLPPILNTSTHLYARHGAQDFFSTLSWQILKLHGVRSIIPVSQAIK